MYYEEIQLIHDMLMLSYNTRTLIFHNYLYSYIFLILVIFIFIYGTF